MKKMMLALIIVGLFINTNIQNIKVTASDNNYMYKDEISEYEFNMLNKIENAYNNKEICHIFDYLGNDITAIIFNMVEQLDASLLEYALDNIERIEITYESPLLRARANKEVSFFKKITNYPSGKPAFHVSLSCDASYSYDPTTYDIISGSLAADNFRWISDNSNYKIISKEHWGGVIGHNKVYFITMAYDIAPKTNADLFTLIHEFQDTAVPIS